VSTEVANSSGGKPGTLGEKAKSWLDIFKDGLTILRDLFLLALFIGFLFFPTSLSGLLKRAGISQINGGIFQWRANAEAAANQNLSAAQDTTAASQTLQDVRSDLQKIASSSADPATRHAASEAASKVEGSLNKLDKANSTLVASYITQKEVVSAADAAAAPSAAPSGSLQGWVYLGEADTSHQKWITPPEPKINAGSPALQAGQTITFTDDVFVRADNPAGFFNQGSVLGAVRAGTNATVTEVRPSHAKNGGDFLWVKINAPQGSK
jgi:hypothetical protein